MRRDSLGNRIRNARKELGLTQPQLAERLGYTGRVATVSDWERGETVPDRKDLDRIAELIGKTYEELFSGVAESAGREDRSPYVLAPTPEVLAILRADAEAAKSRADAAKEWAIAERIAQENTRALRGIVVSADDLERDARARATARVRMERAAQRPHEAGEPPLPNEPRPDRAPGAKRHTRRSPE